MWIRERARHRFASLAYWTGFTIRKQVLFCAPEGLQQNGDAVIATRLVGVRP